VNVSDDAARPVRCQAFLQFIKSIAVLIQHGKVAVDHCIDDGIGQIISTDRSDPADLLPQPVADPLKAVAHMLLKREHEILTKN
jgi:hypothetical protein